MVTQVPPFRRLGPSFLAEGFEAYYDQLRIQDFSRGRAPDDGLVLELLNGVS